MSSVLVLSETYWPYGGAEFATHLILKLLRDEGFNITVVTGRKNHERVNNVKYIYSRSLVPSKIRLWVNLLRLRSAEWLKKLIAQSDVVYVPRATYPIIPLAKEYGKKAIVHLHNYQPISYCSTIFRDDRRGSPNWLQHIDRSVKFEILENQSAAKALFSSLATPLNKLGRMWIAEADKFICVSNRQAEIISYEAPELARKIRVIYNPLPNVRYDNKKVINRCFLYTGGSSFCKGVHILAKASIKFLKRHKCTFILTNMTDRRWRAFFGSSRFNGSFSIFNEVDHEDLVRMYSEVMALLFPSISEEPLPYSILEAMLAGIIPIASKVGGVPEIVQGTYAEKMLFTHGNINEMVDRMEIILSLSKEQIKDIGIELKERTLRRFNSELTKQQLLKVFS